MELRPPLPCDLQLRGQVGKIHGFVGVGRSGWLIGLVGLVGVLAQIQRGEQFPTCPVGNSAVYKSDSRVNQHELNRNRWVVQQPKANMVGIHSRGRHRYHQKFYTSKSGDTTNPENSTVITPK